MVFFSEIFNGFNDRFKSWFLMIFKWCFWVRYSVGSKMIFRWCLWVGYSAGSKIDSSRGSWWHLDVLLSEIFNGFKDGFMSWLLMIFRWCFWVGYSAGSRMEFKPWFLKIFRLWFEWIFILQQREIKGCQKVSWEIGRYYWIAWEAHMVARLSSFF